MNQLKLDMSALVGATVEAIPLKLAYPEPTVVSSSSEPEPYTIQRTNVYLIIFCCIFVLAIVIVIISYLVLSRRRQSIDYYYDDDYEES
ncbi:hypothetical protein [Epinotia aporema granulovirus]|uniref:Uncharacterized protein n=1 Tax=Epinotia aporema granulovirus TaxID=166056 RepID=K4EQU1_9BBAC|nr:hypothetical protein [Epinotia aporema granulovirus]AER41526.1 hypothetical protein [Epinotia aporema granulovirus]